jgi:hypothetical protein
MTNAKSLLDRQTSLIRHLTSAETIFGTGSGGDRMLQGIDPNLLRLEARFSHDKRMEKIAAVFPRTVALLAADREAAIAQFTACCPPVDISRLENARQFHNFLAQCWKRQPPVPPYLPDVAALEWACAQSRAAADAQPPENRPPAGIRRRVGVVLLRTYYDIRLMFEGGSVNDPPALHELSLAVVAPEGMGAPMIFDLSAEVFALLAALDQWTDAAAFGGLPHADALVGELAEMRLVEVCG